MNSDIISSILEIETSAKEKISNAEKLKSDMIKSAKREEKQISDEQLRKAKTELEQLNLDERRSTDDKIAAINEQGEAEKRRLDDVFEKNHAEWTESIFKAVTNM